MSAAIFTFHLRETIVVFQQEKQWKKFDWRVEMPIVHELVEFGTIPGNAQTL
jgi:hypothetical protein